MDAVYCDLTPSIATLKEFRIFYWQIADSRCASWVWESYWCAHSRYWLLAWDLFTQLSIREAITVFSDTQDVTNVCELPRQGRNGQRTILCQIILKSLLHPTTGIDPNFIRPVAVILRILFVSSLGTWYNNNTNIMLDIQPKLNWVSKQKSRSHVCWICITAYYLIIKCGLGTNQSFT